MSSALAENKKDRVRQASVQGRPPEGSVPTTGSLFSSYGRFSFVLGFKNWLV